IARWQAPMLYVVIACGLSAADRSNDASATAHSALFTRSVPSAKSVRACSMLGSSARAGETFASASATSMAKAHTERDPDMDTAGAQKGLPPNTPPGSAVGAGVLGA